MREVPDTPVITLGPFPHCEEEQVKLIHTNGLEEAEVSETADSEQSLVPEDAESSVLGEVDCDQVEGSAEGRVEQRVML